MSPTPCCGTLTECAMDGVAMMQPTKPSDLALVRNRDRRDSMLMRGEMTSEVVHVATLGLLAGGIRAAPQTSQQVHM